MQTRFYPRVCSRVFHRQNLPRHAFNVHFEKQRTTRKKARVCINSANQTDKGPRSANKSSPACLPLRFASKNLSTRLYQKSFEGKADTKTWTEYVRNFKRQHIWKRQLTRTFAVALSIDRSFKAMLSTSTSGTAGASSKKISTPMQTKICS